jgi:gliding motility-associated-like protein
VKLFLHLLLAVLLVFLLPQKGDGQIILTGFLAGSITTCQGAESQNEEIQYFPVSAESLTGNITVSVSDGFLISFSENSGFTDNLTLLKQPGGSTGGVSTIYVRAAAPSVPGPIGGTVTVSSPGAVTKYLAVSANVFATPVADTEKNITVLNGITIPRLNFEGIGSNTYLWTGSNPNIGLAASGVDSLPTFRAIIPGNSTITDTITVTPVWAGMAYVLDQQASLLRIINTVTNGLDTSITLAGKGPMFEVLSADATRLYVVNGSSDNISVVNTLQNKLHTEFTLNLKGTPGAITTSQNDSLLYVLGLLGDVTILNVNDGKLLATNPTDDAFPTGFAVNPDGKEVYTTAKQNYFQGVFAIADIPSGAESGKITIPTEYGPLILTPDTMQVIFIDSARVYDVNRTAGRIELTLSPPYGVVNIASSPDDKTLYVLSSFVLLAYNMVDFTLKWQVTLSGDCTGLAVSPDGTRVYVTASGPPVVFVINTLTQSLIATTPLYNSPLNSINTVTPGGCYGKPITFLITINPAPLPTTTETGNLTALTTIYGTPSPSESFTVAGETLRAGILVAAPAGFEISLDNTTFTSTLTVGAAGNAGNTTVYFRIAAATPVASYSGHVVITSPGAADITVAIPTSTVTPADLTITANNQTKAYGAPLPPLTIKFTGFKNNDGIAQLVNPPVVNTTATQSSPAGDYPITVSAAFSENYTITFVPGVLTIVPNVLIPNTFTPNGDGINDTWQIQKIDNYPDCTVQVFTRYGHLVYSSTGYSIPWDGIYKGGELPTGIYYYVINLNANVPLLSGFVAIIR